MQNTGIGRLALLTNNGGNSNTALGYSADVTAPDLSNATAIGYNAKASASNQIRLGNSAVTAVLPGNNCLASLGNAASKWKDVWACNGVIQTSDSRLKTNIAAIHYGLNEVMSMNPVQYNWKEVPHDNRMLGFIAQEMEQIIPESVVAPKNETEFYAMKYDALIPVLTKAIQEQQAQIESLKLQNAQLGALAQQNQSLQAQLDGLRAEMLSFRAEMKQQTVSEQASGKK
jgi:trimeric autotransporter adhesin